ncbi:MAG: patatin-like phospholipase family protein [Acidimicrobiales bacterium]
MSNRPDSSAATTRAGDDTVIDLRDAAPQRRPSLSMVYGGGGAVGIAWHIGVIDALRDAGLAVSSAPSIGTSAGSWACGAARLGIGFDQFAAFGELNLPDRRSGLLSELARDVFGDARIEGAWISVTALPTMRRHLLDSRRHALADLIAASSAVPGVFAPHTIGGTQYVDGGVRSMASADAAPDADLLVASLPIGGPLFGPVGRAFERTTRRALASWRARHGGATIVLRPGRTFANAVGRSPGAMMDVELAKTVYPIAYDTASRRLHKRLFTIDAERDRGELVSA